MLLVWSFSYSLLCSFFSHMRKIHSLFCIWALLPEVRNSPYLWSSCTDSSSKASQRLVVLCFAPIATKTWKRYKISSGNRSTTKSVNKTSNVSPWRSSWLSRSRCVESRVLRTPVAPWRSFQDTSRIQLLGLAVRRRRRCEGLAAGRGGPSPIVQRQRPAPPAPSSKTSADLQPSASPLLSLHRSQDALGVLGSHLIKGQLLLRLRFLRASPKLRSYASTEPIEIFPAD